MRHQTISDALMCVAAFAWDAHPRWRLIVAANRDEYHDRPTAPLHVWRGDIAGGIIAGRDLRAGGTWLGVHPAGRCVLVTNLRAPGYPLPDRASRGGLVTALLSVDNESGADPLRIAIAQYNPFNLFHADIAAAHILTNQPDTRLAVASGVQGLSNGPFDQPWPKTVQLCGAVEDWLAAAADDVPALFPALADATPLAATRFSSVFIRDESYGTRCSTVLAIDRDGHGTIIERSFDAQAQPTGEVAISFRWP